jgi:hypothetical protein
MTELVVLLSLSIWLANVLVFGYGWAFVRRAVGPSRLEVLVVGVVAGTTASFCEFMWYFFSQLD